MSGITRELQVAHLTPFGVEILWDLADPLAPEQGQQFRSLVFEHGLVLARHQTLTSEQQRSLIQYLGPSPDTPWHVGRISNVGVNQRLGNQALRFHSDLAFTRAPVIAISLFAVDVVDGRSSTKFTNCTAALKTLPPTLKRAIEGRSAKFSFPLNQSARYQGQEILEGLPQHTWPVVIAHPVTDAKLLFVNEMQTCSIEGLPAAAGMALLEQVFDHLYDVANIYEHKWCKGDLVVWDNIALQHARGALSPSDSRILQRVIASTDSLAELCPQLRLDDPRWFEWLNESTDEDPRAQLLKILSREET